MGKGMLNGWQGPGAGKGVGRGRREGRQEGWGGGDGEGGNGEAETRRGQLGGGATGRGRQAGTKVIGRRRGKRRGDLTDGYDGMPGWT